MVAKQKSPTPRDVYCEIKALEADEDHPELGPVSNRALRELVGKRTKHTG